MNEKQKAFLREFAELLDKYNANLFVRPSVNRLCIHSNGETLCFSDYHDGKFVGVMTTHGDYEPFIEGNKNE